MRTIKRSSIQLNVEKSKIIAAIVAAYAKEKRYWLLQFQQKNILPYIKNHRFIRDRAVNAQYQSPYGLQARMWKLALQDAAEMMDRYWQSLFEKIKSDLYQSTLTEEQKHYAFWLLKQYDCLKQILSAEAPLFKKLHFKERKQVMHYLRRKIRQYKRHYPQIKKARSFVLDDNCYDIFEHEGRQYIHIMTLTPRKRLAIPLTGKTVVKGNIRIVLKGSILEIHYTSDLHAVTLVKNDKVIAIDFGYSEVMTDDEGKHYGMELGNILTAASDQLKNKMQQRHKLHALYKKYQQSESKTHLKKAKNILNNNLGRIKHEQNQARIKATISREINTAFNELITKQNTIVISESLTHRFDYHYGRTWNRRLSAWVKGELKDRLSFKALAKGFSHQTVNPAYTSQTCLHCDYVDPKNRNGNRFKCLYCRHVSDADWMAAMNLKSRYYDKDITRYTPYREVKRILLERFHRRLETELSGTVSGRIPDTAIT